MPVMQVIEAQSARTWSLTITSITNNAGRSPLRYGPQRTLLDQVPEAM